MLVARFAIGMLSIGALLCGVNAASGQDYPNKPIRIVTAALGGGTDFVARQVAQGLTGAFGQQVIVDNRSGNVVISAGSVAKAPPDGYTLLVQSSNLWIWPLIQPTPYDPVRDFLPISFLARAPHILVVHPSLPVKSVKELIDLAKAKPGELNHASTQLSGSVHLAAVLFKSMANVNIAYVPYKGAADAVHDLIGGRVQMVFLTAPSVTQHIKSGRLRALAVTTAQPSALASGLPTVAASGLPGYEVVAMFGIFAPATTPTVVVNILNREIGRVLNHADVKERFFNSGIEVVGSSPQDFAVTIKSDMATMGKVIKEAGIKGD